MATDDLDRILARINFDPRAELSIDEGEALRPDPIPWPEGLAPKRIGGPSPDDAPLPRANCLIVTYTAAEGHALADVMTPGSDTSSWTEYRNGWSHLKSLIEGHRAPALESDCAGLWALVAIGDKTAVVFKSDLHPATDGAKLPMADLWRQMITQVEPSLVITTGTAGGVGADTLLGDVNIAANVRWDCQQQFKNEPWAQTNYRCDGWALPLAAVMSTESLMQVNAHHLPTAERGPHILVGDTVTTDFFCFDTADDHYGLRAYDGRAVEVEMDDAALGVALAGPVLPSVLPAWVSVRNASDPGNLTGSSLAAEDKEAASIYQKYGYWTTVGSAITCWALVAGLGASAS